MITYTTWFLLYLIQLFYPFGMFTDAICNIIIVLTGNLIPIATVWFAHLMNYSSLNKMFASFVALLADDTNSSISRSNSLQTDMK